MKLNNKGFSLIEVLAVLVMSTVLLVPLMTSFTSSVTINDISQQRRNATSVASGTLYGLDKIDFSEFRTQLDDAIDNNQYYIEFNIDTCSTLTPDFETEPTPNENFCTYIFDAVANNSSYDGASFKVYLFDYKMSDTHFGNVTGTSSLIEDAVKTFLLNERVDDENGIIATTINPNVESLIRVVVWIDYYNSPDRYVTLGGLIVDD